MKIKYVCKHCGGDNVTRDAWASWDESKQNWIVADVFDYVFCHDCEEETYPESKPLIETEPKPKTTGYNPMNRSGNL